MNRETFNYIIKELTNELCRCRENQSKEDIEKNMFHFYSGACCELRDVIDLICKAYTRKEVK